MNLFEATHYQHLEERRLARIFGRHKGQTLLDVGCGLGRYLDLARREGLDALGVDINPEQVLMLRNQGFAACLPGQLEPERRFDLLLMAHVIEHLQPQELADFLDAYVPRLVPGGLAIIISPVLGARFYYDPTHARPYYPQSLRMLMGGITAPSSLHTSNSVELEDIYFFRDAWRMRETRHFYPVPDASCSLTAKAVRAADRGLAWLHLISGGRLGTLASWMGLYRAKKQGAPHGPAC